MARVLRRQGVDVVSERWSRLPLELPCHRRPTVYPGYRIKWLQREVIDGVQVTRLPLYPNHDQSAIKRVLNYASFAASALVYGHLYGNGPVEHQGRAAVMYATTIHLLTVGIAASLIIIRLFRRLPVVQSAFFRLCGPIPLRATNSGMLNSTPRPWNLHRDGGVPLGDIPARLDGIVVLHRRLFNSSAVLVERGFRLFRIPAATVDAFIATTGPTLWFCRAPGDVLADRESGRIADQLSWPLDCCPTGARPAGACGGARPAPGRPHPPATAGARRGGAQAWPCGAPAPTPWQTCKRCGACGV